MKTVIVHLPTEEELMRIRMNIRQTLTEVASTINRNRTREMYGCTDSTIKLVFSQS
jgi:hypothetical protein